MTKFRNHIKDRSATETFQIGSNHQRYQIVSTMAFSKPKKITEKLKNLDITQLETTIHPEEIMLQCFYNHDKAISIDLIHHMLGGDKWRFKTGGTFKKFIIIVIQH